MYLPKPILIIWIAFRQSCVTEEYLAELRSDQQGLYCLKSDVRTVQRRQ